MKYAIVTFGCRVNQADSVRIAEDLRARGGEESPVGDADLVVVNTCSVTASADQGARQTVRRIARDNPNARIVLTGCYATRRPADLASLPGIVQIVSNDDKLALVSRLDRAGMLPTAQRFGDGHGPCGAEIQPGVAGRTTFTLRVQTGCEERCSYCIIPSTRGAGRSVHPQDVAREVRRIAAAGFKEITLTGVHLGSYGRDLERPRPLAHLLRVLLHAEPDVTFRLSSLEPMDCTREVVDQVLAAGGRIAPSFHLPLQHASDRMLRLMRRPYGLDAYRRTVDHIVAALPHASIGSDMIAGFPGETAADFDETMAYLTGSPLSHLHVFPYSDRPGTEAAGMAGKVAGPVIRDRGARLRQVGAELARRFRAAQIGSVRPGLTLEDGTVVLTDNYLKVKVPPGRARNERVLVRIAADGTGELVSPAAC